MNENAKIFYDLLKKNSSIQGLPDNYDDFEVAMHDKNKATMLYESLKGNSSITGLPDNADDFYSVVGVKKKASSLEVGTSGQGILEELGQPSQESSIPESPSVTTNAPVQNTEAFTSPEQAPIIEQPKKEARTVGEWVLGTVKAFDQSLAGIIDALDYVHMSASDAVNQIIFGKETAVGIKKMRDEGTLAPMLNPKRPFKAISDAINYAHSGAKPLPTGKGAKGITGDVLSGAAGVVPDILAAIYAPEVALPSMFDRLGLKVGSKFGMVIGAKSAIESTKSAEEGTTVQKVSAPILGGIEGYMTGWMFDGIGHQSAKIGENIANKIFPIVKTEGEALNKALTQQTGSMLSNALFFGGYGTTDEYLRTGKISPETFATNAGMGIALGIREPGRLLFAKGVNAFIATPKEVINRMANSPVKTEEYAKEAQDKIDAIEKGDSPNREGDLAAAKFNANMATLNAIVDEIRGNKDEVVKVVNDSELEPKAKEIIIDKINEVDADNDPKVQATKDVNDKIASIDEQLESIRANKSWDEARKEVESAPLKEKKLALKEEAVSILSKPISTELKLGDKTFKDEKELTDWLDKNYNETDRFTSVNEEGYLEPNTMKVFNKWYKENKVRLQEEDFARIEKENKATAKEADVVSSEKVETESEGIDLLDIEKRRREALLKAEEYADSDPTGKMSIKQAEKEINEKFDNELKGIKAQPTPKEETQAVTEPKPLDSTGDKHPYLTDEQAARIGEKLGLTKENVLNDSPSKLDAVYDPSFKDFPIIKAIKEEIEQKPIKPSLTETKPPTKAEQLKAKEQEVKNDLANNIEGLMSSIGGIKEFSGEQRATVVDYVKKILKNLADLTGLKGEQLYERLRQELKKGKIDIPDDVIQEAIGNEKTPESATQPKSDTNVPPTPSKPVTEGKTQGETTKIRGAQVNALIQDKTEGQKVIKEAVERNQERYTVLHGDQAVQNAKDYIDKLGVEGATADLIEKTTNIDEYPTRQVARLVLLDSYSRLLADKTATEVDRTKAFKAIDRLQTALAREGTKTGQGNALLDIWKAMQPAGLLEYVQRKNEAFNQKKLDKKIGDTTVGDQITDLYNKLTEANKEVVDQILNGKDISSLISKTKETATPAQKKFVPKELIQKEKDYRKNLLSQYRATDKTANLSVVGLSSAQIELGGNLLASYVREGYYRVSDIIERLKADYKSIGVNLSDDQINTLLKSKKDGNKTFRTWLREQEAKTSLTANMKEQGDRIQDVIKKHWTEKDEFGRTLAQKFIDEAGVSGKEAQELEKIVLAEYQKLIKEKSEKELTKVLGTQKIPTKGKNKVLMDKMFEALNMGALDTEFYGELFADKFGLVPKLKQEQMSEIMRLASNVQQTSDMGWFSRDATIDLTKYIYELYPQSRVNEVIETWNSMAYANMLFGLSTTVLNLWSAGSNIGLRPFKDAVNLTKWVDELRKGSNMDGYNPFGEMVYAPALRGIAYGAKEAAEVYLNGDLNNKYIEDVTKKSKFSVSPLERNKYGKAKRFKPIKVKVAGKEIDLNIFNLYKYSGRNLSAQDKMMLNMSYDIEIASILRDHFKETTNLRGRELTKKVMEIYKGKHVDFNAIEEQITNEAAKYKELTGKDITPLQRKIRAKELERDQLPLTAEQKAEAEQLARSSIFTDDRGGMLATLANGIGWVSNSNPIAGAIIKPHIPFTKIVGNVGEYMFDHIPVYGFLRANGYSVSGLKKLYDSSYETAQMGEKGSKAYYEQMGRAWFGTISFGIAMALLLGSDEDDYIQITGGYQKEGFNKAGRANVTPKYTLRIGEVEIPYLNIPSLAIPFGIIGNLNDAIDLQMPEEEITPRLVASLALDASAQSMMMIKDMSFVDGVQNALKMFSDAASMETGAWKRTGKTMAKTYLGYAARPLPQNNNAVQQIWKFFDPTSYSQKEITSLVAYAGGLQHFVNTPTIDQLGDVVTSYPGESLMPYTHWSNIRGEDDRWKFLAKHNAIPPKIPNMAINIETENGVEPRTLDEHELHDYTLEAGTMMSKMLVSYMNDKENVTQRAKDRIVVKDGKGQEVNITGIQEDVQGFWDKARADARTALFYWGEVKETMPKEWKLIYENKAYMPYATSKTVDGQKLDKAQLYRLNTMATTIYAPMVADYLQSKLATMDKKSIYDEETGETEFENEIKSLWREAMSEATDNIEDILWDEQMKEKKK